MLQLMEIFTQNFLIDNPLALIYLLFCALVLCALFQLLFLLPTVKKRANTSRSHLIWVLLFLLYLALTYYPLAPATFEVVRGQSFLTQVDVRLDFTNFDVLFFHVALFFPLGVLLPMLWPHLRTCKQTASIGFAFSLFIQIGFLWAFHFVDLAQFLAHGLGFVTGYVACKGTYRFFNKGMAFHSNHRPASYLARHEASFYLALSFLGVFLFYAPARVFAQQSPSEIHSTIGSHHIRNDILIPLSDFNTETALGRQENGSLAEPEDEPFYVILLEDFDDPFGNLLCELLQTCLSGSVVDFTSINMEVLLAAVTSSPLFSSRGVPLKCQLEEGGAFLFCEENPDFFRAYDFEGTTFAFTDETSFEIWLTDGFGDLIVIDSTKYDLLQHDHVQLYPVDIDGEWFVERVISYRMQWDSLDDALDTGLPSRVPLGREDSDNEFSE